MIVVGCPVELFLVALWPRGNFARGRLARWDFSAATIGLFGSVGILPVAGWPHGKFSGG